ncbi:hypothetical protein LOK49_LG15G02352 [Camellia lanceoleosa]|uniref:Uncharacterized protein n=1 Tax=Camellia lanceoleosa TaxID=1840588 RepID=A0ACC0F2S0_9ERIC|nr:hypothetical protein LOK49_LG15G02352 [Camellia lanceoleosa]
MGLGLLASRALSFKSPNLRYAIVRTIISTAELEKLGVAAKAQPPLDDLQNRTPVGGARLHFSNPGRRDRGEFNNHEAARLCESLRLFEEEEPILRMRRLMNEAIADERFEDAARYRDEQKDIAPHSLLKCSSDATTLV